ncbi:hypothetical protein Pse7367_2832 [Thalassoporum mexicanum PCC 7367]|uniref:hypothetical protein n=1 Tax=Thalassoporum mexicanum TaxID=3457544 RepID=UPI00029FC9CA|nr:hypothetical protein [Pseudanabaena sp. PCC 7367]AFY71085.1 hypothetical protein Pse7367_2832 [Pseudanabaena sp. PCC 7367]
MNHPEDVNEEIKYYNDLSARNDSELELLLAKQAQPQAPPPQIPPSPMEIYRSSYGKHKQVEAIELLWHDVAQLRLDLKPSSVLIIDCFSSADEYFLVIEGNKDKPEFQIDKMIAYRHAIANIESTVLCSRPFVSEYLYILCLSYWAILTRIHSQLIAAVQEKDGTKCQWYQDAGILALVSDILNSDREFAEFKEKSKGKFVWLRDRLEEKIIAAMRETLAGEESVDIAIELYQDIREKVDAISLNNLSQNNISI